MLGRRICRDIASTDTRGNRCNIDNTPIMLFNKSGQKSLRDIVDAVKIDSQHTMPEFIWMSEKFMTSSISCIVDQNINASQALQHCLSHSLHLLRVGDIAGSGNTLPTKRLYF